MKQEDLLFSLTQLGLNLYEAKIYLSLVNHGSKTAGDLSFLSGVPRSKIYGSLKKLELKKLIKILHTKPVTFEANPPDIHLKPILERIELEAKRTAEAVESLAIKYESLKNILRTPYTGNISALQIKGRKETLTHLNHMFEDSLKSIKLILSKNSSVRIYKSSLDVLLKSLQKKVEISFLTPHNVFSNILEDFKDIGNVKSVNLKFSGLIAYVDSKESMSIVSIPDDTQIDVGEDIGVWISHPKTVTIQEDFFNFIFSRE